MVWAAALLFFALLLYFSPMAVFVRAAYDGHAGAWVSVGFVLHPLLVERTVYISRFPQRPKKADVGFRAVLRVFHGLWQKRGTRMDVKIEICAQDAAQTALLCGGCWALGSNIADRVCLRVIPQFRRDETHFALRGMLWAKTGHIVLAAYAYFRQKRRKENGKEAH